MQLKANYDQIIQSQFDAVMNLAGQEELQGATGMAERNLLLIIDMQNDFMDDGALPVKGAKEDSKRASEFIYKNMDKLTRIAYSLDTHDPFQIFHPCWWVDKNGKNPKPYTPITLQDLNDGNWMPVIDPVKSRTYVEELEKRAKKTLMVWPYHCIQGTSGANLEDKLAKMVYFHEVAKKAVPLKLVKGTDPFSEMYGIIKPEYDTKNWINMDILNVIESYDKIIVMGQAGDFCVFESVKQIAEYFSTNIKVLKKIHIVTDCMSTVLGKPVEEVFNTLPEAKNFVFVKSTDLVL